MRLAWWLRVCELVAIGVWSRAQRAVAARLPMYMACHVGVTRRVWGLGGEEGTTGCLRGGNANKSHAVRVVARGIGWVRACECVRIRSGRGARCGLLGA